MEPLQTIGLKPGADQGRVRVAGSSKPSKGRDKGFKIERVELIQTFRELLDQDGRTSDELWTPPTTDAYDENDDDIEEIDDEKSL